MPRDGHYVPKLRIRLPPGKIDVQPPSGLIENRRLPLLPLREQAQGIVFSALEPQPDYYPSFGWSNAKGRSLCSEIAAERPAGLTSAVVRRGNLDEALQGLYRPQFIMLLSNNDQFDNHVALLEKRFPGVPSIGCIGMSYQFLLRRRCRSRNQCTRYPGWSRPASACLAPSAVCT